MTAPRDFEPVRGFVLCEDNGKAVQACDVLYNVPMLRVYPRESEAMLYSEEGDVAVPSITLPLTPPPDALERMAKAIQESEGITIRFAEAIARRAFAALVEGVK